MTLSFVYKTRLCNILKISLSVHDASFILSLQSWSRAKLKNNCATNSGSPEVELRFWYCSNIELGGLTWALLSVPIMCMKRGARSKASLEWQDLRLNTLYIKYMYTERLKIPVLGSVCNMQRTLPAGERVHLKYTIGHTLCTIFCCTCIHQNSFHFPSSESLFRLSDSRHVPLNVVPKPDWLLVRRGSRLRRGSRVRRDFRGRRSS